MRMNLDHVANGHFVLGRGVLCEFDYWPLAVCLQRRYARCPLLIRFHPVIIILALLRRGFGTSVPFIETTLVYSCSHKKITKFIHKLTNSRELHNHAINKAALIIDIGTGGGGHRGHVPPPPKVFSLCHAHSICPVLQISFIKNCAPPIKKSFLRLCR